MERRFGQPQTATPRHHLLHLCRRHPLATLENGVATIVTQREGTLEWLTTRLAKKVKLLLTIEAKIAGKDIPTEEVRFEVFSAPDETHQE